MCLDGEPMGDISDIASVIQAEEVHRNYIISTWLLSAGSEAERRGVPRDDARAHEEDLAKSALAAGWVFVMADREDPSIIYGWVAGDRGILHWAYVPPGMRGQRVFTSLVAEVCGERLQFTRKPRGFRAGPGWEFNPYRIAEYHHEDSEG